MRDLSLHIMDIVQNSIKADADHIVLNLTESQKTHLTTISITDNGIGIDPGLLPNVTDPYTTSRTTRKVGLGIPLFKQNAEKTGGTFFITSQKEQGTKVITHFQNNHIDCLPLGDVAGVIMLLVGANPNIRFEFHYATDTESYSFDTIEVQKILGDVPLNHPEILKFIKEMIEENIQAVINNSLINI